MTDPSATMDGKSIDADGVENDPKSPKKIQFEMPSFQTYLDPASSEQIRRRRPTPASLILLSDQSSPEEEQTSCVTGINYLAQTSQPRPLSVFNPPTRKGRTVPQGLFNKARSSVSSAGCQDTSLWYAALIKEDPPHRLRLRMIALSLHCVPRRVAAHRTQSPLFQPHPSVSESRVADFRGGFSRADRVSVGEGWPWRPTQLMALVRRIVAAAVGSSAVIGTVEGVEVRILVDTDALATIISEMIFLLFVAKIAHRFTRFHSLFCHQWSVIRDYWTDLGYNLHRRHSIDGADPCFQIPCCTLPARDGSSRQNAA
ncbi:uncharacterized protein LOC116948749 isoform X2 [Petromyzon marinus]